MGKCPRCIRRYAFNRYDVDFVHVCNSGETVLDNEPRKIIGDYVDEVTGNTVLNHTGLRGIENKLWSTDADLDKETLGDLDEFGKRKSLYRQRQHFEYIPKEKLGKVN